jgi:hypothetical protein
LAGQVAAAIGLLERGAKEFEVVLRLLIPLTLAAVPVVATAATPLPNAAWWEKVTIKMTGDGTAQACQYTTSRAVKSDGADCKVEGASGVAAQAASSPSASSAKDGSTTTITFERRFTPGTSAPGEEPLGAGDKLLGKEVMALAIDHAGKVSGCRVVDTSGDTGVAYGCDEATAEKFETAAAATAGEHRLGFMTILVYGHNEHVV